MVYLEDERTHGYVVMLCLCLIATCCYGYIANICKLVWWTVHHCPMTMMWILRIAGIFFPPLGIVIGFMSGG